MTVEQLETLETVPETIDTEAGKGYDNQSGGEIAAAGKPAEDAAKDPAAVYESTIEAKDAIIAAYETQVESLKRQISNLIRNGAVVTDSTAEQRDEPDPMKIRKQNYELFSDLGKEIGR